MIRFLSALLFALTLLFFITGGLWLYTVDRAETRLAEALPRFLGAEIHYDHVEKHYNMGRIRLTLKDVLLQGQGYRMRLGDVLFESDFLGRYRLELALPKRQELDILKDGRLVRTYTVLMEKGLLQFYPDEQELVFSALGSLVRHKGQDVWRSGLMDASVAFPNASKTQLTLTLKKAHVTFDALSPLSVPSFTFKGGVHRLPDTWREWAHAFFISPTADTLDGVLSDAFAAMRQSQTQIDLDSWAYRHGQRSCIIKGRVGLDSRLRAMGSLDFLFSQNGMMTSLLTRTHLLGGEEDLALNPRLSDVLQQEEHSPYTYAARMQQGELILNGVRVGVLVPLSDTLFHEDITAPVEMEPLGEETIPGGL